MDEHQPGDGDAQEDQHRAEPDCSLARERRLAHHARVARPPSRRATS